MKSDEIKTITSALTLALEAILTIEETVLQLNKKIEKIEKQLEPHANFVSGILQENIVEGDIDKIKCGECRNQYNSEYCIDCSMENNFKNFEKEMK